MEESHVIEEIAPETADVAQTAITMMFVLEDHYQIDIEQMLQNHVEKLDRKVICPSNKAGKLSAKI